MGLPTVTSTQRTGYVIVLVRCKSCHHQGPADLPALIAAGKRDTPLIHLKWRWRADAAARVP